MPHRFEQVLVRIAVTAVAVAGLALAVPPGAVVHAAATSTVAFYSMDEPAGSAVLVDSSGHGLHGRIGLDVVPGVRFDGSTAHRYPQVSPDQPPTHPEHIDRVPDSALLDPGDEDYAVTIRYRTTNSFGNIVQKGQNGAPGGYWKFEAPHGIVTCLFKGGSGSQRAVSSVTSLADGQWHTVRCERTSASLTMYVDGVRTQRLAGYSGTISNNREITIAGKGVCDQITVTCDYFSGDIDFVRIERGSGGPANVAPTAAFTTDCVGLVCTFSAAASTDIDGAIQTYAWDFGDATTGSWSSANHTYSTAGTYTATLTVVDDRGASSTTSQLVAVEPAAEVIAFVDQVSTSGNFASHAAVIPTSVQAGDGLLMFFSDNNTATIGTPTGVTGWKLLDGTSGGYGNTRVWSKVAAAADAGATVRVPLSKYAKGSLVVVAYRGTGQKNPVASFARFADTANTATRTTPAANVVDARSWVVSYWMHGDSTTTSLAAPAGLAARGGGSQSGSGRVTTLVADSGGAVPSGTYGGLATTAAAASITASTWTIVLAPDTGPVANIAPQASSASSCTQFACSFDATASTDSDGWIDGYTWDFGDGTTATGATTAHSYSTAGTYQVALTVTDDSGATTTALDAVTVPYEPPVNVIGFVGSASSDAVGTVHSVVIPSAVRAGDGLLLFLGVNTTTSVAAPAGVTGWQQLGVITAGTSRTRVWRKVAGAADAGATVSVTLGGSAKAGLTVAAYSGTSTSDPVATFAGVALTTTSASHATPTVDVPATQNWAVSYWTHTDSISSALTPPAGVTVRASGTQTSSNRVTTLVADSNSLVPSGAYGGLTASAPSASTAATAWTIVLAPSAGPLPNAAPGAAFSSSCTDFTCTFDGGASTDRDGVIQSHAWDFGDGTTGSGVTTGHTYTTAGSYTVTLTATDDGGVSGTATRTVTVPLTVPVVPISHVGQTSSNLNATTHSVRVPSEVQAGDALVLFFAENTTATIGEPAGVTGWTRLDTVVASGTTTAVWRKVAAAGDAGASVTVTVSAISKAGLTVLAYRGTSATDPVAGFARVALTETSATRTTPQVSVADSRSWVVSYWTHKDSTTDALLPPSGITVRASGSQTSGGRVTTLLADSATTVAAGTYGALTATAAAASSAATGWTIVLAPSG